MSSVHGPFFFGLVLFCFFFIFIFVFPFCFCFFAVANLRKRADSPSGTCAWLGSSPCVAQARRTRRTARPCLHATRGVGEKDGGTDTHHSQCRNERETKQTVHRCQGRNAKPARAILDLQATRRTLKKWEKEEAEDAKKKPRRRQRQWRWRWRRQTRQC